jgi:hypothetical protein
MPTSLTELTGAEAHNLEASTRTLGTTVELLNDFEGVYEGLPPIVALPEGGPDSDEVVAVVAIM